jgi:LuxR family quorum-sensing system transcriptional regulator CciR
MVTLTRADRQMLEKGQEHGLGNGFTVPVHVPGETCGSVSFVVRTGKPFPDEALLHAQLLGNHAFEAARRMCLGRTFRADFGRARLTDRQRECVLWTAQGKTDAETAIILGLSQETVTEHVSQAYERYGVNKRTPLVVRTIFDGTFTFPQILRGRYPHFWG